MSLSTLFAAQAAVTNTLYSYGFLFVREDVTLLPLAAFMDLYYGYEFLILYSITQLVSRSQQEKLIVKALHMNKMLFLLSLGSVTCKNPFQLFLIKHPMQGHHRGKKLACQLIGDHQSYLLDVGH